MVGEDGEEDAGIMKGFRDNSEELVGTGTERLGWDKGRWLDGCNFSIDVVVRGL